VCNEDEERDELLQWNVANFTSTDHQACFYVLSPGVSRYESLLFNTYYCFRVVCVHVLPCTSLVVLNSALLGAIRTAQRRRHRLLRRQPNPDGSARLLVVSQRQRPSPGGLLTEAPVFSVQTTTRHPRLRRQKTYEEDRDREERVPRGVEVPWRNIKVQSLKSCFKAKFCHFEDTRISIHTVQESMPETSLIR